MYSREELFLRSLECYFGVYFPRCFATREKNTKITLSWALKQFVTRVHTLFSIFPNGHEQMKLLVRQVNFNSGLEIFYKSWKNENIKPLVIIKWCFVSWGFCVLKHEIPCKNKIIYGSSWITIFYLLWSNLPMIFTCDCTTHKNHWNYASIGTFKMSLFTTPYVL